jgi:hypothetical protein
VTVAWTRQRAVIAVAQRPPLGHGGALSGELYAFATTSAISAAPGPVGGPMYVFLYQAFE